MMARSTRPPRTADPAARLASLQRAEGILLDEAPLIPLYFWTRVYLLSSQRPGLVPQPARFASL